MVSQNDGNSTWDDSLKDVVVLAPLFNKLPVRGYGATERLTIERVESLRRAGYKVQLVGHLSDDMLADSVLVPDKLFSYPKTRLNSSIWLATFKWTEYIESFCRLKEKIWNAPILSDAASMDPFNNFLMARCLGISRLIFFLHGNFYYTNGVGKVIFDPIDRLLKLSWRLCYGALNTRLNELLQSRGLRSFYLPNGLSFPGEEQVDVNPDNYLVFVGAIKREKAPHLAIKVAKRAGIPLRIIGPIHDHVYFNEFIRPLLTDQVTFLNEIDRDSLNSQIRHSKGLLFSSIWNDPQPTVILEALSYGLPVIALKAGYYSGLYDMVDNGRTGIIGSMEELVRYLPSILEIDRREIYREAKKHWSWDFILKEFHIPMIEQLRAGI